MKKLIVFASATILPATIFTLSSCKENTNEAPAIEIWEPANNATITLGDTISIEGIVTDNESLHEFGIVVTNAAGDSVLEKYPVVHDQTTYNFSTYYVPAAAGAYAVRVFAEDHDGVEDEETRAVTVTP